ncbi:unnamed protein product [Penicillium manginii]
MFDETSASLAHQELLCLLSLSLSLSFSIPPPTNYSRDGDSDSPPVDSVKSLAETIKRFGWLRTIYAALGIVLFRAASSSRSPRGSPGASSAPPEADLAGNGLGAEAGAGAAADVDPEADGQGELPRLRSKTAKQEKRKDR